MALVHLDILRYTQKFICFPPELLQFAQDHQIPLPQIHSLRGQALALLAQSEIRGQQYMGRKDAVVFFHNIGMETQDSIQPFNKAFGLKRIKLARGFYCLEYPFVSDRVHLDKRTNLQINIAQRDDSIHKIKNWWRENCVDVPNEEWHIGHLDPTIADTSEQNLVFQPPIQAKYRDRFKWDALFMKMWPTGKELTTHFDKYYTLQEKKDIYHTLCESFAPRPVEAAVGAEHETVGAEHAESPNATT